MTTDWTYDEFKQTGLDFGSEDEVRMYDEKFRDIRNFSAETENIARCINLTPDSVILEIGTGTGEHAVRLAPRCRKVVATDISDLMLAYAGKKALAQNVGNIQFLKAGFLTMDFPHESFDAVVSQLAMHHLPDFWKAVAIHKISQVLKPGGRFYFLDHMMSFEIDEYQPRLKAVIEMARKMMGDKIADEIVIALREEYLTFKWILEAMLAKSGLRVEKTTTYTDIMSLLVCVKD
jgi:putative AdoMet-dependent methyltransferase